MSHAPQLWIRLSVNISDLPDVSNQLIVPPRCCSRLSTQNDLHKIIYELRLRPTRRWCAMSTEWTLLAPTRVTQTFSWSG